MKESGDGREHERKQMMEGRDEWKGDWRLGHKYPLSQGALVAEPSGGGGAHMT